MCAKNPQSISLACPTSRGSCYQDNMHLLVYIHRAMPSYFYLYEKWLIKYGNLFIYFRHFNM